LTAYLKQTIYKCFQMLKCKLWNDANERLGYMSEGQYIMQCDINFLILHMILVFVYAMPMLQSIWFQMMQNSCVQV
jgi:hypothetical protein